MLALCALQLKEYALAIEDANKCIAAKPDWALRAPFTDGSQLNPFGGSGP